MNVLCLVWTFSRPTSLLQEMVVFAVWKKPTGEGDVPSIQFLDRTWHHPGLQKGKALCCSLACVGVRLVGGYAYLHHLTSTWIQKNCESHFEKCHFQLTFGFIIPFHVWFSWCLAGVLSPDYWFYRFKLKVAWSFQLFIYCVFGICNLCHKSIYPMEGWLKDVVGKEPRIQEYPKTFVIVREGDTADGSEIRLTMANQLRLLAFPIIYKVLYIPSGCLGFLPSTVLEGY